jgi:hypothetical protein
MAIAMLAVPTAAMADKPASDDGNGGTIAATHNTKVNENAVWGQDRSFYASTKFFGGNMDIKQSFPTHLGSVSEQRAAWVATYGPDAE